MEKTGFVISGALAGAMIFTDSLWFGAGSVGAFVMSMALRISRKRAEFPDNED